MRTFLIVAGVVWFAAAMLMVLAVACAARRRMPQPSRNSRSVTSPVAAPLVVNSGTETLSKQLDVETLVEK